MNVVMTGDGRAHRGAGDRRAGAVHARAARRAARSRAGGIEEIMHRTRRAADARVRLARLIAAASLRATRTRRASSSAPLPSWEIELLERRRLSARGRRDLLRERADQGALRASARRRSDGCSARTPGSRSAALGGRPGVHSARWAEDGVARLLAELDGESDRRARYVCELVALLAGRRASCAAPGRSRGRSRPSRAATRASATTRSSSPRARRGPWRSSATTWKAQNSHRARAALASLQATGPESEGLAGDLGPPVQARPAASSVWADLRASQ